MSSTQEEFESAEAAKIDDPFKTCEQDDFANGDGPSLDNDEVSLRMACLHMACGMANGPNEVVRWAQKYYEFATGMASLDPTAKDSA